MSNTQLPQTLKGFRDFLPEEKTLRDVVLERVLETFKLYGFQPLETPTLEYASLLLGKYGNEADKLVYTFTDNGDRCVGLRYDQTVPTARVLAQYKDQLPTYFRRYQVQNVFRADKPQKGRYREFTQCDIDIFGSSSPLSDAEIIACTYASFIAIGFKTIVIKVNDRRVLTNILQQFATDQVSMKSIIQSIDKLDKMSAKDVADELIQKGLSVTSAMDALAAIEKAKPNESLNMILTLAQKLGVPQDVLQFTPSLARGLDYYTGMIFEVMIPEFPIGSFGGGGRYDNLIQQLGGADIPAVGIAFGFDRIVEAVKEMKFISAKNISAKVLVTVFDGSTQLYSAQIAASLRKSGISTELYPAIDKLSKQFKYAAKQGFQYAVVIGPE
ncbi:MAG: histidine--tRNA ligase, partial [Patescibacteria group bacterium]